MAANTLKCSHLMPLHFKGLSIVKSSKNVENRWFWAPAFRRILDVHWTYNFESHSLPNTWHVLIEFRSVSS